MKIKTVEDFKKALLRLDEIFDIPVDDPRRDERAALIDAVEKYEDEHCHIQPPTEEEERAFRREQELLYFVEDTEEVKRFFEIVDFFAEDKQEEIYSLMGRSEGLKEHYEGAVLDNRGIRITYRKHYGFRPIIFEIPLEYMNNLDGWLEELRKEK